MNCPVCGVANEAGAVFCYRCGSSLAGPTSPAQSPSGQSNDPGSGDWATPRESSQPPFYERPPESSFNQSAIGPSSAHQGGSRVYNAPPVHPSRPYVVTSAPAIQQTSNLATISLILGIVSFVFAPFIAAVAAIITGHMGRNEVRASGGRLSGEGMATAGLILGYLNIALSLLVFVFLCILPFVFAAAGS